MLAGLAANLVIPMIYIFGVTLVMRLWYEPDEAQHILVGLALVAAMPIAGASTAWAQNSNGNLALSLVGPLFNRSEPYHHTCSAAGIRGNGVGGV